MKKSLEPSIFTLTQNTWVEILPVNRSRRFLDLRATTTADRSVIYCHKNPWSYLFNSDAYIDIDAIISSPNIFASMSKGTIKARLKIAANASQNTIFDTSDNSASDFFSIYEHTDGKLSATLVIGSVVQWTLGLNSALTVGEWYNIILVHDGSEPILFVDGQANPQTFSVSTDKTKFISDVNSSSTLLNAQIGATQHGSLGNYFEGTIDSFSIVDHSENIVEICSFEIDEGTGTVATDKAPYSDNGTIVPGTGNGAWAIRPAEAILDTINDQEILFLDSHGPTVQMSVWGYSTAVDTPIYIHEGEITLGQL